MSRDESAEHREKSIRFGRGMYDIGEGLWDSRRVFLSLLNSMAPRVRESLLEMKGLVQAPRLEPAEILWFLEHPVEAKRTHNPRNAEGKQIIEWVDAEGWVYTAEGEHPANIIEELRKLYDPEGNRHALVGDVGARYRDTLNRRIRLELGAEHVSSKQRNDRLSQKPFRSLISIWESSWDTLLDTLESWQRENHLVEAPGAERWIWKTAVLTLIYASRGELGHGEWRLPSFRTSQDHVLEIKVNLNTLQSVEDELERIRKLIRDAIKERPSRTKDDLEHFKWLIDYQVKGLTWDEMVHKYRPDVSSDINLKTGERDDVSAKRQLSREVNGLSKYIGLTRRKSR